MECTNCCFEGGWSPQRAVLAEETTVDVVLCDVCREALHDEEWIEFKAPNEI